MTTKAEKFTPEILLSAPRRSAAVPNADGTLALYTVATYSFESHKKTNEIRVLNLATGQSTLITNEEKTSEPNWLGDKTELFWLKEAEKGHTKLIAGDAGSVGNTQVIGTIPGPISNVKVKSLGNGKVALAVVGKSRPDGSLFNPGDEPQRNHTGLLYDKTMVRHWDKYEGPYKQAVWYAILEHSNGKYSLSNLVNALRNTKLESPMPPWGGSDHFDLSSTGIIFVARDPDLNPAFNTKCDLYYVPLTSFSQSNSSAPQKIEVEGLEGAASSPAFSPDGKSAAFLKMRQNGYESDKNRVIIIPNLSEPAVNEVPKSEDEDNGPWDRSPLAVTWSNDGKALLLQAEEKGRTILFKLDIPSLTSDLRELPVALTAHGSVSDVRPLAKGSPELFVSSSSMVDNSYYGIVNPSEPLVTKHVSSNSLNGSAFGLKPEQVSSFWVKGSGDYEIHSFIIRPSDFRPTIKYPLAFLIHGGPQGAWEDSWSTRWNPAIFAEQGYVVIAPNPTGSTGYGQAYVDAIQGQWGGLPYKDLMHIWYHIQEKWKYIDMDATVALGASYGGYMINWIQGHEFGRKFKALVCHDGVFSMANQLSSDEQYFPNHDLTAPYWEAEEEWEKWNPAKFTKNWKTPQLVIHNELDYRLPISEGLAAFNVLQEQGVKSQFLTFPDENHWVLKEENSLFWHTVVLNFINKHTGLPPYNEDLEPQNG